MLVWLLSFWLSSQVHADAWTGNSEPIVAPIGDCSLPSDDFPSDAAAIEVTSRFQYLSCREYRASGTKALYYQLEFSTDGEYTHMLPRAGQNSINLSDYRESSDSVVRTCMEIRDRIQQSSIPLSASSCRGMTVSL